MTPKTRGDKGEDPEDGYRSSEEEVMKRKGRISHEGRAWTLKHLPEKYGCFPDRALAEWWREDLPGRGFRRAVMSDHESSESTLRWARQVADMQEQQNEDDMQARAARKNGTRWATREDEIEPLTMEELRSMVEVPGGGKLSDDLHKKEHQKWLAEFDKRWQGAQVEDVGTHPKYLPPCNPNRFTFRDMIISRSLGDHNVSIPYKIFPESSSSSSSTSSSADSQELRERQDAEALEGVAMDDEDRAPSFQVEILQS